MIDLLPDSRPHSARGAKQDAHGRWWVPVFCANCGADGGWVPEENMTFIFYQCDPCAVKYGEVAGTMKVPDEVFWERVKQEQLEKHGRILSPHELQSVVESNTSPLATLILEGR